MDKAVAIKVGLVVMTLCVGVHGAATGRVTKGTEFVNGRWFNGESFVYGPRFVVDGRFTITRPAEIERTVDLEGRYVVPPFGEAHNHNTSPEQLLRYFAQGIFYVKNPNSLPRERTEAAGHINSPTTADVVFANGGLTGPGGHPISIVDRGVARGYMTAVDGDGGFFHAITDRANFKDRWPGILAGRPDFIKTYVLYSEKPASWHADPKARGWRGLAPDVVPDVVAAAHAAGLRVSAHVETADDFNVAVEAGVDEISHLPGFRGPAPHIDFDPAMFELTDEMARAAAHRGTVVVTTVSGASGLPTTGPLGELRKGAEQLYRTSLRRLHDAGVAIAIGSDRYEYTSLDEVMYLQSLRIFDNLTLLKFWTENTAATIFPARTLGRLTDGAEASFLVLDGNPLEDLAAVRRITMRVKQGVMPAPAVGG